MKAYIVKKFDKREVGTIIDSHESIIENLILKGLVSIEMPEPVDENQATDEVIEPVDENQASAKATRGRPKK